MGNTVAAVLFCSPSTFTAIVPLTPSNIGVFQAACIAVLAAFGVAAGRALACGLVLQAIEIISALALGLPALVREGLTPAELRRQAHNHLTAAVDDHA
jgi:phosphatidylinositol alpha-mannosyltransferase